MANTTRKFDAQQLDAIVMAWYFAIMIKTQVQLPDELYKEAKRIAQERELSLAEVIRRGIEYMARVYPPLHST